METKRVVFIAVLILMAVSAPPHERPEKNAGAPVPTVLQKINGRYLKEVKPIFAAKCFDCHSASTRYPRYYRLPIARQMIDADIREGREHIDMTLDYPFAGHHSPEEQLTTIAETVRKNSMPPWDYRLMHRGSRLTPDEARRIREWVQAGLRLLSAGGD